jgi:hypothetical protein
MFISEQVLAHVAVVVCSSAMRKLNQLPPEGLAFCTLA